MRSLSAVSARWAGFTAALGLAAPGFGHADALVLSRSELFGRIVAYDAEVVRFAPGCGKQVEDIPAREVRHMAFNKACQPNPIRPYSAGAELCGRSRAAYRLKWRGVKAPVEATDVRIANGRAHLSSLDEATYAHGPSSSIESVTRTLVCNDGAPAPALSAPAGYCLEARQWAVNFGPEPAFRNRILTRGVSFYLEDDDGRGIPSDDPRSVVVRDAFGGAVTRWIGALQDHQDALPPEVTATLQGMISRSEGGYQLLTPPQVVRVGCRDTATFVVRYLARDARSMVVSGHKKLARAQVEGRTLWINGVDYPCWRVDQRPVVRLAERSASGATCLNLIPVMIHEVGHALGLAGHADTGGSIMDSVLSDALTMPTAADVESLAAVLSTPVQGAEAGLLDADAAGLELAEPRP